jgi:hypothetical protein
MGSIMPAVWVSATYGSGAGSGRPGDIRLAHYSKETRFAMRARCLLLSTSGKPLECVQV